MKPPIWFSAGLIAASVTTASATPQNASHKLSSTEEWVVAQATAGQIAHLSEKFPKEEDRKLSALFLEDLLTGTVPGVKLHRHGVQIVGAIIDEPIDLRNAHIPCEVHLENCQFRSYVIFVNASFAREVSFDNSTFKAGSAFIAMHVGDVASFDKAVFEGPAMFIGADIARAFHANEGQFKNKAEGTSFNSMKVGHLASFNKAVFEGPVDFVGADIAGRFTANEAQFKDKKEGISFNSMKVGNLASFNKAVFEGPGSFIGADIAGDFDASEAQFKDKQAGANFDSMQVGQIASFNKALFEGPAMFIGAHMAGPFFANAAQFRDKKTGADFFFMKVGQVASFIMAVFEGPVDFRYADFVQLDLSNPFWPKLATEFRMQEMSYKYIRAASKESESHKALLKFADQSAYTADVYTNLEQFFKRQGYRADADRAFIAGKCREREEYFRSGDWGRWLGSWMLYLLVGYGRHPERAGYVGLGIVVLGCILFPLKKMELQDPKELEKPKEKRRQYNRFWYSLGLFLPVVDLKTSEVWGPRGIRLLFRARSCCAKGGRARHAIPSGG